jgi:hypoxanthine phosphoribosyltransferase
LHEILDKIDTRTKAMAAIALVVVVALPVVLRLIPTETRFYALLVFIALLVLTLVVMFILDFIEAKANFAQTGSQATESRYIVDFKKVEKLVPVLAEKLETEEFVPDVIIGLARSGLVVAAYLSQRLDTNLKQPRKHERIPVVSLCKIQEYEKSGSQEFENSFSHIKFKRDDLSVNGKKQLRVLIVDDACVSGRSLRNAKQFVENSLDTSVFQIRRAAIVLSEQCRKKLRPKLIVDKTEKPIVALNGKLEDYKNPLIST